MYNPDPLPVHGWAKRQGYKPGSVEAALTDPRYILGDALPGFVVDNTRGGSAFNDLGLTDIALAAFGTGKRGLTTKTPIVKPPPILRRQGVKPEKPENKRILDPSAVVNAMAPMVQEVSEVDAGGGKWFDTNQLLTNLANTKKKSAVGMQLNGLAEDGDDVGGALRTAGDIVRSIVGTMPDSLMTRARMQAVDNALANTGATVMRRKPKQAYRAVSELAKQFLV